ncbi:MAG: hypothetical protein V1789_05240 [PVC group bacterium]
MIRLTLLTPVIFAFLAAPCGRAASPDFLSWDFSDPGQIKNWTGEGIEASRIERGAFQFLGGERVQLVFPPGLNIAAEKNPCLRIRLRTFSPRIAQVFWVPRAPVRQIPAITLPQYFDRHFHSYWIDLADSLDWIGTIDRMGIVFGGNPGWIEIDSIEVRPFSLSDYLADQWREFWLPRSLHLGTINSLNSPRLFNKPFISWLNRLAVLVLLIGAILYYKASKANRIKIAARIGLAILALWIIYDVRETFSQFKIVEEIYQSYVKPPPEEKTFPALGDFYHFVEFCRKHIPDDAIFELLPYPYWPFDCRLKYFLYPARMEMEVGRSYFGKSWPKYFIVYQAPGIIFDSSSGRLMIQDGKTVFSEKGSLVARYDSGSFIYKVEKEK